MNEGEVNYSIRTVLPIGGELLYQVIRIYNYRGGTLTLSRRGYTAPRTNLIPELQQRYQPIENLMLWQRLVTKGKQKLGLLRRQRSS